jgi:hypothetical protein
MSIQAMLPSSREKRKLAPVLQIERWKWQSKATALRNQTKGKVLHHIAKASS